MSRPSEAEQASSVLDDSAQCDSPRERAEGGAPSRALPFWWRQTLPGIVIAIGALRAVGPVADPDAYWHVRAGQLLAADWQFVRTDTLSASSEMPWISNQWLPQLIMAKAYEWWGLPGVAWLTSVGVVLVLVAIWLVCRRRAGLLITALVMAMAFVGMSASLSPRPQLLTFTLTVVVTGAWLDTIEDGRARWWLIPLSWLWSCSHGLWFIGPAVGFVVLLGMAVARVVDLKRALVLVAVPLLSVVVAAITPVGLDLLRSPFQVQGVTAYVTEWQPPSASDMALLTVLLMAVVVVVAVARKADRPAVPVVFLLGFSLYLAMSHARTVALAAAILAPLAAGALQGLLPIAREPVAQRERLTVTTGATVSLALAALLATATAASPGRGPNELSPQLMSLPAGSIVCNEWEDGGWLILEHPNVKVTQDPRAELYTLEHIRSYLDFVSGSPGWQQYPVDNRCNYALLDDQLPVTESLRVQRGWTVVASRDGVTLLKAPVDRT